MVPYVAFFESDSHGRITKDESPEALAVMKRIMDREIDKLEAGPELDAIIAEKVMGLKVAHLDSEGFCKGKCCEQLTSPVAWQGIPELPGLYIHGPGVIYPIEAYSTDIAAAWEVVEKLDLLNDQYLTRWDNDPTWAVCISTYGGPEPIAQAGTAPLAICRAAQRGAVNHGR